MLKIFLKIREYFNAQTNIQFKLSNQFSTCYNTLL